MRQGGEWTRGEVATYLSRSKSRVIELEKQGKLHPRRGDDGHWYHSAAEVEAYRRSVRPSSAKSAGGDADEVEILRRIHAGEDAARVAVDSRTSPRRLAELLELYERLRGRSEKPVQTPTSANAHPTLWTMLYRSPADQSRVEDMLVRGLHGEDVAEELAELAIAASLRITDAARAAGDI